jgi:heme-degrading monooxygenase HmoA
MYIYIWEYKVKEVKRESFEKAYGPDGDWVGLFAGKDGYIRTEFFNDVKIKSRYLTIDYWDSEEKLRNFRREYKDVIDDIDMKCSELTQSEIFLGEFSSLSA